MPDSPTSSAPESSTRRNRETLALVVVAGIALLVGLVPIAASRVSRATIERWIPGAKERVFGARFADSMPFSPMGGPANEMLGRIVPYLTKFNPDLASEKIEVRLAVGAEVNAYAIPGGTIAVSRGLIRQAKDEEEIVALVAHEIAHLQERHVTRGFGGRFSVVHGAAWLALLVDPRLAAQWVSAGDFTSLGFSSAFEREADALGVRYVQEAGSSGAALARLFEELRAEENAGAGRSFEILASHSVTASRLSELRDLAKTTRRRAMFVDPIPFQIDQLKTAAQ